MNAWIHADGWAVKPHTEELLQYAGRAEEVPI
jgi:hypothetical protein